MFYGTDEGNKLVDENNYPTSIKKFLESEKDILVDSLKKHDVFVEVGCMEARNMQHAIRNKKKYIGIDIVPEYIKVANEIVNQRNLGSTCEFICMDAENLDEILRKSKILKKSNSPLFFFPFNSFGNMNNFKNVISSIKKIKNSDFIISTYKTDKKSTQERYKYYNNCNYDNLTINKEKNGIRFTADNGLNSMAYNENFLQNYIKECGLDLSIKEFANIGIAYMINTREKDLER